MRSSPRDPKAYLADMMLACDRVCGLVQDADWTTYQATPSLRWAVERQLCVLGEALYQLRAACPELAAKVPDSRDIVNFRHVLVHGYAVVEDETVWGIVVTRISPLGLAIDRLLDEMK